MTVIDKLNEFCDATSVAAAAGTALLGSQIDLASTSIDIGNGEDCWVVITTATEIITGGSAGTILFKVVSDASASIATDGSATVHLTSNTYTTDDAGANSAALNAGGVILAAKLPSGTYERYLGIICTIGTTTVTEGAIDAYLTKTFPKNVIYPNASL